MKNTIIALAFALGCAALANAQDSMAQEVVTGSLHVIWIRQSVKAVEPSNPNIGLWVSLHSDDETTVSFQVTLRYRLNADGPWQTFRRQVDNSTEASGGTYWVSTPAQCLFAVPWWPVQIEYSVQEDKAFEFRALQP